MHPDLDQKLCKKYPLIFKNRYKDKTETCLYWGLEVPDRWYGLIDTLCTALTYTYSTACEVNKEDVEQLGIEAQTTKYQDRYYFSISAPQVVADQVKQKFDQLRFYYHLEFSPTNEALVATGKYPALDAINNRYANYIDGIVHFAMIASEEHLFKSENSTNSTNTLEQNSAVFTTQRVM